MCKEELGSIPMNATSIPKSRRQQNEQYVGQKRDPRIQLVRCLGIEESMNKQQRIKKVFSIRSVTDRDTLRKNH